MVSVSTGTKNSFSSIKQNYKSLDSLIVYLGNKNDDNLFKTYFPDEIAQKVMNNNCDSQMTQREVFERYSYSKRMERSNNETKYYEDASLLLESIVFEHRKLEKCNGIYICANQERKISPMEFPSQYSYQIERTLYQYEFKINDKITFIVSKEKDSDFYSMYWKCIVDEYVDTTLDMLKQCLEKYFK